MKVFGELRELCIKILEKKKKEYNKNIDKRIRRLRETGETE